MKKLKMPALVIFFLIYLFSVGAEARCRMLPSGELDCPFDNYMQAVEHSPESVCRSRVVGDETLKDEALQRCIRLVVRERAAKEFEVSQKCSVYKSKIENECFQPRMSIVEDLNRLLTQVGGDAHPGGGGGPGLKEEIEILKSAVQRKMREYNEAKEDNVSTEDLVSLAEQYSNFQRRYVEKKEAYEALRGQIERLSVKYSETQSICNHIAETDGGQCVTEDVVVVEPDATTTVNAGLHSEAWMNGSVTGEDARIEIEEAKRVQEAAGQASQEVIDAEIETGRKVSTNQSEAESGLEQTEALIMAFGNMLTNDGIVREGEGVNFGDDPSTRPKARPSTPGDTDPNNEDVVVGPVSPYDPSNPIGDGDGGYGGGPPGPGEVSQGGGPGGGGAAGKTGFNMPNLSGLAGSSGAYSNNYRGSGSNYSYSNPARATDNYNKSGSSYSPDGTYGTNNIRLNRNNDSGNYSNNQPPGGTNNSDSYAGSPSNGSYGSGSSGGNGGLSSSKSGPKSSASKSRSMARKRKSGNKSIYSSRNENSKSGGFLSKMASAFGFGSDKSALNENKDKKLNPQFNPAAYEPNEAAKRRALARATGRKMASLSASGAGKAPWPVDISLHHKGGTSVFGKVYSRTKKYIRD